MKIFTYDTSEFIACAKYCGDVIICLQDSSLSIEGNDYIEGRIVNFRKSCDIYFYSIQYNEADIASTPQEISKADVAGITCRGCWSTYVDNKVAKAPGVINGLQQWVSPVDPVADNTAAIAALTALGVSDLDPGVLAMVVVADVACWFKYTGAAWVFGF